MFDFQGFKDSLKRAVALAMAGTQFSYIAPSEDDAAAANARAIGGYNRRRAVSAAASKRAATKRRNIAKRSPH